MWINDKIVAQWHEGLDRLTRKLDRFEDDVMNGRVEIPGYKWVGFDQVVSTGTNKARIFKSTEHPVDHV